MCLCVLANAANIGAARLVVDAGGLSLAAGLLNTGDGSVSTYAAAVVQNSLSADEVADDLQVADFLVRARVREQLDELNKASADLYPVIAELAEGAAQNVSKAPGGIAVRAIVHIQTMGRALVARAERAKRVLAEAAKKEAEDSSLTELEQNRNSRADGADAYADERDEPVAQAACVLANLADIGGAALVVSGGGFETCTNLLKADDEAIVLYAAACVQNCLSDDGVAFDPQIGKDLLHLSEAAESKFVSDMAAGALRNMF
ncbi:hypothetical protein T492DRAFT_846037 [Pavlovales sp. CCMP2436]|nr:hypothetical protein T492DRAFT_846037 [Pavlovales sp. CCMP2436]